MLITLALARVTRNMIANKVSIVFTIIIQNHLQLQNIFTLVPKKSF